MSDAREFLFSLAPGRELATLQAVIEVIDGGLDNRGESIASLVDTRKYHPSLKELYQQHDPDLANKILTTIGEMLTTEDSIQNLIARLDNRYERDLAAIYLGWFGTQASQALPDLIDLASGSSGTVGPAKQAIRRIGNAETSLVAALHTSILCDDDGAFREVCDLLITMGYESTPMLIDLLDQAAQSINNDMRIAVADAISKLNPSVKKQLSTLLERLMTDANLEVMRAAKEAL